MPRTTIFFAIACIILGSLPLGCSSPDAANLLDTSGEVKVVIDFNGRKPVKKFQVSVGHGSTALSVLEQARKSGEIQFVVRGNGETAFVTAIDGLENENARGDNWTFRVNGDLGDRGCGVFGVKPADEILWLFGKYP